MNSLFPVWTPLAVLLANGAFLLWRRPAPHIEVPVLLSCLAVFLALVLPITPVTFFAVGSWLGYYAYIFLRPPRPVFPPPSPHVAELMDQLAVLLLAHHKAQISDEQFHREYEATMNAFEEEGCDVLVNLEPEPEEELAVRIFVHKRKR